MSSLGLGLSFLFLLHHHSTSPLHPGIRLCCIHQSNANSLFRRHRWIYIYFFFLYIYITLTDFTYSITIMFIYIESIKYNTYIRQGSLGKVPYMYSVHNTHIYKRHRLAFVAGKGSHYETVHIIRVYYNIISSGSWEGYMHSVHANSIRILVLA